MLKDIPFDKVKNIGVAIVRETNDIGQEIWNTYILNYKEKPIDTVLITSKGYGVIDKRKKKTAVLRYLIQELDANSYIKFEPLDPKLFGLFNEFWVSFRCEGTVYDKKFLFVPNSVSEENMINISMLGKEGVLIK